MRATLQRFTERTQLKAYARQLGRNLLLHNPGQIFVLYRRKPCLPIEYWRICIVSYRVVGHDYLLAILPFTRGRSCITDYPQARSASR
jgi:hypothetical protein